jgi:hypothetical protein
MQGFERTGTTGRHVRWILPSDIYLDTLETNIEGNDEVSEEKEGDDEEHESEGGSVHVDAGEGSHLDVDQNIENQISSFDVDHGDDDEEMASQGIENE